MALREQQFSDDLLGSLQISRLWARRLWEALPELAKDHEYAKMAAILSKLLCSKAPRLVEARENKTRLYISKLLEYGYEPLRSTGICPPERLQRYLRRMLTFKYGDANREEVGLELTSLIAEKESLAEADDLAIAAINLSRRRYAPEPPDPVTVAFAGHVAFRWWQQEMKAVASNIQGLEDDLELEDETQSDWDGSRFAHDPMQWMSSGARMRDLWNASEQRFQEAWRISAEASDVGWKLVELYCKAGKHRQALEVAVDGAGRAPADADLQALLILLARACNAGGEVKQELAEAHLHLLQDDPFCCSAVAGLLESRALLDGADVLEALLSHLNVCPKLDCFGWQGLAGELENAQSKSQANQALPTATEAASRELWKLVQHHRPFCQPLAVSPLLQRLLEPLAPVSGATMRQERKAAGTGNKARLEDRKLREDVEGGVEQGVARMQCLAFLDASIGSRFSARLQDIGCQEEAEAVEALVAFGQSCAKDASAPSADAESGTSGLAAWDAGPSFQTACFGSVKRLPLPWWQSFPEFRRKRVRGAEPAATDAADAEMALADASPG